MGQNTAEVSISSSLATGPFISYAQNFEDVMLWRALRNVSGGQYLDVGAAEPDADSVTKAFYDLGWRGVNVEPLEGPFKRLVASRPGDVNLNVALGFAPGEASLYVVGKESGLSTLHEHFAAQHEGEGWELQERRVLVTTLAEICATHVTGDLHFLKIDAEGSELDILQGADFTRWRPWIILLEAVDPVSHRPSPFGDWENQVLTPNGYVFVYDDGLNRFYVSSERKAHLSAAFRLPPNVFDNFIRVSEMKASKHAGQAEEVVRLESLLHAAQERADFAQSRVHAAQASVEQEQARVAAAESHAAQAQSISFHTEARLNELAAAMRQAEEQATVAHARCLELEGVLASQPAQLAQLKDSLALASVERDSWAQELFETNRYAAELVIARQMLTDELNVLRRHEELRVAQVADLTSLLAAVEERAQHAEASARKELQETQAKLGQENDAIHVSLGQELEVTRDRLNDTLHQLEEASQWLDAVRQSSSWRVTRPVRVMLRLMGRG